jgi:hypothetical protein
VVVAFQARAEVSRCLASLREHAGASYQAILVDDASADGTPELVHELFPEVQVIAKSANEGLPAGRNSGIARVRGRIVLMLDADTRVTSGAVPTMVDLLDREPSVGIVVPRLLYPDGRVQPSCRRWPSLLTPVIRRGPLARLLPAPPSHLKHMMHDFAYDRERPVVAAMGAAHMWRADLPFRIGPFDERISSYGGEDVDWCLRTWSAGMEVRFLPSAEVIHDWQHVVRHGGLSRHSLRALRDFYYLQWKHRGLRSDPRLSEAMA